MMILHIKNMVSSRCIKAVELALDNNSISYQQVNLGEVELLTDPTPLQYELLKRDLIDLKMDLLTDKTSMLIATVKNIIISMIHFAAEMPKMKTSKYISQKTHHDYVYLSNIFSKETGDTIEHYIIHHKIERVKELITENELNLTEISFLLNYSSVAHLSRQFRKITGLTASCYKKNPLKLRTPLEDI